MLALVPNRMHPIRFGLKVGPQFTTIADLIAVWSIADQSGFDHCWINDHLATVGADPTGPVFEAWSLMGAMAQATSRLRIGVMVTGNTYRHPGLLAKAAVTVDRLSEGRLEMGIGAGWAEREHTMFGLSFGTAGERINRMAEAITVLKLLWGPEPATFEGDHYSLTEALAFPKPIQKPWPPLWIGGQGERKTLRVVAEHADVWNTSGGDPSECARLSAVLDRHCDDIGRDPSDIRRSAQIRFDGSNAEFAVRNAESLIERGFSEIIVYLPLGAPVGIAEMAASGLLPRLKRISD